MYLNQITFPDRESEGSFLRGLCELSMIPITLSSLVKERLFSNRF